MIIARKILPLLLLVTFLAANDDMHAQRFPPGKFLKKNWVSFHDNAIQAYARRLIKQYERNNATKYMLSAQTTESSLSKMAVAHKKQSALSHHKDMLAWVSDYSMPTPHALLGVKEHSYHERFYGKTLGYDSDADSWGEKNVEFVIGVRLLQKAKVSNNTFYDSLAIKYLKEAANGDYACAQLLVAQMYYDGIVVEKSYKEALKYFEKAINNKKPLKSVEKWLLADTSISLTGNNLQELSAMSSKKVGMMYYNGTGTEKSYAKAIHYLKLAAIGGDAEACYMIGQMYCDGTGVDESSTEARKWYARASQLGYADAKINMMYCASADD